MTKILIIDDADDIRFVASYVLGEMAGLDVFTAATGEDGVRLAAAERPDCILLDLVMPGTDGAATLELLRAEPETRGIAVIFLTSRVRANEVASRYADQVAGVIQKPFDVNLLAEQVREILENLSTNSH
jgi:two-component system, OmpR family, alkaline phosphatase synthesis response regulator PhoP